METIPVGILGATGMVGQRFIMLLAEHPYMYVAAIGASARSAGKPYEEACSRSWKQTSPPPENVASMTVQPCDPSAFVGCRIIFSGLDSDVATEIESAFRDANFPVLSNAKNFRMDVRVPLIVPTVNTHHLAAIPLQREALGLTKGALITNANCSTTGLVVALKPLIDAFGPLKRVLVTTMQAISGAGYPGVASLDILGNVVPYISGEEEKMESEASKILGDVVVDRKGESLFDHVNTMRVSASCFRVAVVDGHTESVSVEFERRPAPTVNRVIEAMENYRCEAQDLKAPSAPTNVILVSKRDDRPQPILDGLAGKGYSVTVGRVRPCNVLDIKFVLLSHNTILGAAGSAILNAEVAVAKGLI